MLESLDIVEINQDKIIQIFVSSFQIAWKILNARIFWFEITFFWTDNNSSLGEQYTSYRKLDLNQWYFWELMYNILLWINRKSVSRLIVDNRRRLILKRLNKFANIERYWKIIGKARIVGSKGKFDCLGRCMKMVIDNKTGWNIMDRN